MASGKKNYFRHSMFARNDDFIVDLMEKFGLQGYFYYFALIEMCAELSSTELQEKHKFHKRTLVHSLRLNTRKLNLFLTYLQDKSKISYTIMGNQYEIILPNLSKYMGKYSSKYTPNTPNKRKEKEKKEKEKKKQSSSFLSKENAEKIYQEYPVKKSKAPALKKLQTLIKSQEQYDTMLQHVTRFASHVKSSGQDLQYVKHMTTWLNQECWNDELPKAQAEIDREHIAWIEGK